MFSLYLRTVQQIADLEIAKYDDREFAIFTESIFTRDSVNMINI